ncbi:MAG: YkgJ family cysteine cluster protein [Desulfohalobiaceae bacterium]
MQFDFSPFFVQYEKLVQEVEQLFQRVKQSCPQEVTCYLGCSECCYAMFDLTLVEAMYINQKFQEQLSASQQEKILENADQADRQAFRIKRDVYRSQQKGKDTDSILDEVGRQRVRCPLLSQQEQCLLYAYRPITCRLYGVPMSMDGVVSTCAHSGFKQGGKYPTVYMEKIYKRLQEINHALVQSIPTKHTQLAEVLVPLSMALLNKYDAEYLGIVQTQKQEAPAAGPAEWTLPGAEDE